MFLRNDFSFFISDFSPTSLDDRPFSNLLQSTWRNWDRIRYHYIFTFYLDFHPLFLRPEANLREVWWNKSDFYMFPKTIRAFFVDILIRVRPDVLNTFSHTVRSNQYIPPCTVKRVKTEVLFIVISAQHKF